MVYIEQNIWSQRNNNDFGFCWVENKIGAEGTKKISEALKTNTTLTKLSLDS